MMSPTRAIISDLDQVSHPIFSTWRDSEQIEQRCNNGKDRQLLLSENEIQSYSKTKTSEVNDFASASSCKGRIHAKDGMHHSLNERKMISMKTQHLVKECRIALLKTCTTTNPKSPADSKLAIKQ